MREMKDSGIAWIGEIPSEWKVCKLLNLLRKPITDGPHETPVLQDIGIPFISVDSLNDSENIDFSKVKKFISDDLYEEYSKKTILEENDILFTKAATIGKTAIVKKDKFMVWSPLAILKCNNSISYYRYVYHLMNCQLLIDDVILHGSNNTQINVGMRELEKINTPLPPLAEQQFIASFLDKKCSEIDTLISLQEEMISELQAYKQSVITEAVTLGTNRSIKLVDSGEEWLGKIPANWSLLPIKALFDKRNQKNNPIISTERLSLSIGLGITKYADKTTNLDRYKDDFTAYQIAYPNDIVLNSMNMIVGAVGKSTFMGCVSPVYYVITAKEDVNPDFFGYLLNTPKIRDVYHSLGRGIYAIERGDGRVNTCRLKVPYYDFSIIKVPVPPYEEQTQIAAFINDKLSQIDSLISLKQEKIQELKDYKKSIIYEYVTGKKRV